MLRTLLTRRINGKCSVRGASTRLQERRAQEGYREGEGRLKVRWGPGDGHLQEQSTVLNSRGPKV